MKQKKKASSASRQPTDASNTRQREDYLAWAIFALTLLFILFVRVRLLSFPLERDEGGFAYMGKLILEGVPPYTQAYDFKPPGLYATYALFIALFGASSWGIHFGLMLTNIITTYLVFIIARRFLRPTTASLASACYGVLSISPTVLGFAAHATHFVILHALIGTFLLLKALESKRLLTYFWSGCFFGLSYLMKQQGVFFGLFAALVMVADHIRTKPIDVKRMILKALLLGGGAATPIVVAGIVLYLANAFSQFWFWCFVYTSTFGSGISISEAPANFMEAFPSAITGFVPLWILALAGLIVAVFWRVVKQHRFFILSFFVFSFISVCPGFYFRQHYFILLLPAVALLVAVALEYAHELFSKRLGSLAANLGVLAVFLAATGFGIVRHKPYFFTETPEGIARVLYGPNPFPEDLVIAKVLEARTKPDDKIVVLGSEPQIYFYSNRRAASGHIFTYWLVEPNAYAKTMQEQMIAEIEASKPKYLVFVNVGMSWAIWPQSEKLIFQWYEKYGPAHYDLEGLVDIQIPGKTEYYWDDAARTHSPVANSYIIILKRREAS